MALSVAHGSLTAGGHTGASITLTGTAATIDTALATLSYSGNANFHGGDTLTVTATSGTVSHSVTLKLIVQ